MIDKNIIKNFAIVMGAMVGLHKNTKEVAIKMKEGSAKDKTMLRQKIVYSIFLDFIPDALIRMHSMQSALNFRENAENMLLQSPEFILADIAFQEKVMHSINAFAKIQSFAILQELLKDMATINKLACKMNISSQKWFENYFISVQLQTTLVNDYNIFIHNVLKFLNVLISINLASPDDYNNVVYFVNSLTTEKSRYELMIQVIKAVIPLFLQDLRISKYFNINIQTLNSKNSILLVANAIDLDIDTAPLEIKISGINYTKKHYDYVCATINSLKQHKSTILYLTVSRQPITETETDMVCDLYGLIQAHNLDSKIFDTSGRNLFIFGPHSSKELNIVVHEYLDEQKENILIDNLRKASGITTINLIGLADGEEAHLNFVKKLYGVICEMNLINLTAFFITQIPRDDFSAVRFWLRPTKELKLNNDEPGIPLAKNINISQDLGMLLESLQKNTDKRIDDFIFMHNLQNKAFRTIATNVDLETAKDENFRKSNKRLMLKL